MANGRSAGGAASRCAEPAAAAHQGVANFRPPTGPRCHIQARRQGGAAPEHAAGTTAAPLPPSVPQEQLAPATVQAQAHEVASGIGDGGLNSNCDKTILVFIHLQLMQFMHSSNAMPPLRPCGGPALHMGHIAIKAWCRLLLAAHTRD